MSFNGVPEESIFPDYEARDLALKPSTSLAFLSYGSISGTFLDNDSHTLTVYYDRQYSSSQFSSGSKRQLLTGFSAQDKHLAPCIQLSGRIRNERVRFYYFHPLSDCGCTLFFREEIDGQKSNRFSQCFVICLTSCTYRKYLLVLYNFSRFRCSVHFDYDELLSYLSRY